MLLLNVQGVVLKFSQNYAHGVSALLTYLCLAPYTAPANNYVLYLPFLIYLIRIAWCRIYIGMCWAALLLLRGCRVGYTVLSRKTYNEWTAQAAVTLQYSTVHVIASSCD